MPVQQAIVINGRKPSYQNDAIVLQKRYREDLPDNDTFCLYYDLLSGRFPVDEELTIEKMADICKQSVTRFYKSLKLLEEAHYIERVQKKVPGRTRAALEIILLNIPLMSLTSTGTSTPEVPTLFNEVPVPTQRKQRVIKSSQASQEVTPTAEEVAETPIPYKDGWGKNPVTDVHTLIDTIHEWTDVPKITYTQQHRAAKLLAQAYTKDQVRERLEELWKYEKPYFRHKRITVQFLHQKMAKQRSVTPHDQPSFTLPYDQQQSLQPGTRHRSSGWDMLDQATPDIQSKSPQDR